MRFGRRALGALLSAGLGVAGMAGVTGLTAAADAAGILPPANPSTNVPLPSSFDTTGPCQSVSGGYTCQTPCFSEVMPSLSTAFTTIDETNPCVDSALQAIDSARAAEGVGPMNLPSNWYDLTIPQQVFVVINLERVDRDVAPLLGMNAAMDVVAQQGAEVGADPQLSDTYGDMASASSGGIWAAGQLNPLVADYEWMYADGYSPGGSVNIDCASAAASGCWGHRDIILGSYTGVGCTNCVLGAGFADAAGNGLDLSYAAVIARPSGALPDLSFTWAQEQSYLSDAEAMAGQVAAGGGTVLSPASSASAAAISSGPARPPNVNPGLDQPFDQTVIGITSSPDGRGYSVAGSHGGIKSFGDAADPAAPSLADVVGVARTPDGKGWWTVSRSGAVDTVGDAPFYGSAAGRHLSEPIVGMAATPDGHGYWLVARNGRVLTFGDASFYGSAGGSRGVAVPVMGIAPTTDGHGYWLVARNGGVFSFGDAGFFGSAGRKHLAAPVVGLAPTARRPRLLAGGRRRRRLQLRGRRLLRIGRRSAASGTRRRPGAHARRPRLLAGRRRRRRLQLRGRRLLRLGLPPAARRLGATSPAWLRRGYSAPGGRGGRPAGAGGPSGRGGGGDAGGIGRGARPFPSPDREAWAPAAMPAMRLESSMGTTSSVELEVPSCFSASKYCRVMVRASRPSATSPILDRARAKPSARRMAAWRSPSAERMADCFWPSATVMLA